MRVFAIDLDGTLLHSTHRISERNVTAVKDCQKNGDIVVIATGRAVTQRTCYDSISSTVRLSVQMEQNSGQNTKEQRYGKTHMSLLEKVKPF